MASRSRWLEPLDLVNFFLADVRGAFGPYLGIFLLTGFMSRVCGLVLACLGAWQVASYGLGVVPVLEGLIGVHFMLRGGGAWAMDIYVQKMQDRVRRKSISSPEST